MNLSKGMAYKAALAGLDLGGGKAVIIGDLTQLKTEALLRAYGRFVESLHGRYYTACDVGTFSEDMDHIARECSYVTGRTVAHGGAGDSSVLTAYGVFQGMRAAAEVTWGAPTLHGRTVGVAGVGKVGRHLVTHLVDDGADVVITDVDPAAVARVQGEHPDVREVATAADLVATELDVYAPCALGGALDDEVVATLSAKIVCGAANNQLAHEGIEKTLQDRGILYAPDYMVNAGGLIQVADELEGFVRARQAARGEDLRHHQAGVRAGRRRGAPGRGRGPARRAADDRGRTPAVGSGWPTGPGWTRAGRHGHGSGDSLRSPRPTAGREISPGDRALSSQPTRRTRRLRRHPRMRRSSTRRAARASALRSVS